MKNERKSFRRVLDLCDELDGIKDRLVRRKGEVARQGSSLLHEKREKLGEIWDQIDAAFAGGALGEMRERFALTREELLVVALLVSRRIRKGNRGLTGRAVLSTLYESTYDMVRGMSILRPEGSLRKAGMVVAADPYRQDVFEARFRLSDEMFYAITDDIEGTYDRSAGLQQRPYRSAREHLLDMGRLTGLYRLRAAMLFPVEAQDFFTVDGNITLDEIEYRIEAGWADIEGRLLLTPQYEEYPLVRLERKYTLSREELIIIVSLFFVELVSPAPYLVVGDLVKLVSRDEEDLMRMRRLVSREAALVSSGLLMLDEEHGVHRKLTTFDAYLADWVVENLSGPAGDTSAITTDLQIDVHEFLKGLSRTQESD